MVIQESKKLLKKRENNFTGNIYMFNNIVEFVTTCESCQITKPPAPPTQMQVQYLQDLSKLDHGKLSQLMFCICLHQILQNKNVVIFVDLFTLFVLALFGCGSVCSLDHFLCFRVQCSQMLGSTRHKLRTEPCIPSSNKTSSSIS